MTLFSVISVFAPIRQFRPIRAPLRMVEPIPIKVFVPDRAAVQHHLVADRAVLTDRERETRVDVEHAAVLDVAAFADLDGGIVRPHDRAEPDAGFALEADIADQDGSRGDPALTFRRQHGTRLSEREQLWHGWAFYTRTGESRSADVSAMMPAVVNPPSTQIVCPVT